MNGWHCEQANQTLTLLCRCSFPQPFSFTKSHSSRTSTKCCCEWQLLLTHVVEGRRLCMCAERRWREKKKCTWINDVLEQVHKWEAPMFVSKDNAVLICELWAWFECLGYSLSLVLHTHTYMHNITQVVLLLPEQCICVLFLRAVSWILTWRGESPLCPAQVQVLRRWLQATNEY